MSGTSPEQIQETGACSRDLQLTNFKEPGNEAISRSTEESYQPKQTTSGTSPVHEPIQETACCDQSKLSTCCYIQTDTGKYVCLYTKKGRVMCFLAIKILLVIVVSGVISTSGEISKSKPCELEKALKFIIKENTIIPCRFSSLRRISSELTTFGIVDVIVHCLILAITLVFGTRQFKHSKKKLCLIWIFYVILLLLECACWITTTIYYTKLDDGKEEGDFDYLNLKEKMVSSLERYYTSDNIGSNDEKSNSWNLFFMEYDCCAVNEVVDTYNDFDRTPWCTTSGSCQATASQIPKTCCKDVTKNNYDRAPSNCYASVSVGTYKPSCINQVKLLSRDSFNDLQVSLISIFLHILLILRIIEWVLIIFNIVDEWCQRMETSKAKKYVARTSE